MKRFAICNHKGGVGKSTIAINLAGALSEMGYRVLVVDCDAQGDTSSLLVEDHHALPYCVADLFASSVVPTADMIQRTAFNNLDVITSDGRLNIVERTHGFESDPITTGLADALTEVENDYDIAVFDCPTKPHLSGYAAMVAADEVIVPCEPSQFPLRSLVTVNHHLDFVRRLYSPHLRVRYLLSRDKRSKKSAATRAILQNTFGAEAVFTAAIPNSETIDSAINLRKPVVVHSKRSAIAHAIRTFALEVITPHYAKHESKQPAA